MALHLYETNEGYICDHGKPGSMMLASVPFIAHCEECIRKAFAEALERTLRENGFSTP